MSFFAGFDLTEIQTSRGGLRVRVGGEGPPLLLLHGNPQTHAMWHAVAPELATSFRVICPDLPGYGGSFKPDAAPDHAPNSKRAMAGDMVDLLAALGHRQFAVLAHDRGARVAHRLALDHPDAVTRLALLDIIPTLEHFERTDMAFAMGYYHWFWLAQRAPIPESIITAAPETWWHAHTAREPKDQSFWHPDALADYLRHIRDPATVTSICEDYRAAATIDLDHDRASRAAGQRITCPLMILWGSKGKIGEWYDAPSIWSTYADNITDSGAIESGHYLAEENPDDVLARVMPFFKDG
ncbi:MAG: alpha/beta hydrolase [Pseudomonadota bacterium]